MTIPKFHTTDQPVSREDLVAQLRAWDAVLREATTEVFSTMIGVTVDVPPAPNASSQDASLVAYVTGMIGIAGAMRAVFSLRCSDNAAIKIASRMLCISAEEAAAQKSDAIGEVCNIIAGHFKHKIGYGDSCTLTVPTVVVGGNYSIHCLEKGERLEFPVAYEGETVSVTLDIRS
ncbi:MAG TPA: chemotaxis protein CheX [Terriglobales bacterium]|nr:chemotaxis protein CheX [Terriglobales bacterium]